MTAKTDLRIKKSKYAIEHAFWKLLLAEGFSKITIQQIIDEAHINRATLYKYYANKYELLDRVETTLINEFKDVTEKAPDLIKKTNISQESLQSYYKDMVRYIYSNRDKFSALLAPNGDPTFINKLITADEEVWQKNNITQHLPIPEHYASASITGMVISLIAEWIKSDFKESADEFMVILQNTIMPLFSQETFFKTK
ncbi:TetR/AcrR family transcriptional regulator [Weissella paramesenteroides]|jgi:AcrR family transcriptional regulator|uniref:TetR/AcrR family transcriptional regulator n=1 Tax=Weissella paramesenteroides TaxID=1249 RepID=UPI003F1E4C0D